MKTKSAMIARTACFLAVMSIVNICGAASCIVAGSTARAASTTTQSPGLANFEYRARVFSSAPLDHPLNMRKLGFTIVFR